MKIALLTLLGLIGILSPVAQGQQPYGEFTSLKRLAVPASSLPIPVFYDNAIAGFAYGNGVFWCLTQRGDLLVIDTSGNAATPLITTPRSDMGGWCEGGICYDGDTLWITTGEAIIPMDAQGRDLGPGIPVPMANLLDPVNPYYVSGIVKDADGFWLLQGLDGLLYHVNRSGMLTKQFPNAWFNYRTANNNSSLTWFQDRLLLSTGNVPPSNGRDLWSAMTVDTATGDVVSSWGYPEPYSMDFENYFRHIGFSAGEGCLWLMERTNGTDEGVRIRKIALPAAQPFPQHVASTWGEFSIEGWKYAPLQGGVVEGIFGLGCQTEREELWITAHIGATAGYKASGPRYFTSLGVWANSYYSDKYIPRDICFVGDSMWIADYWPGMVTASVRRVTLMPDGSVAKDASFDVGLEQIDGIATDGVDLWVSGRSSAPSTGMPAHEIKKVSRSGQVLAHHTFPDLHTHNYADLAWHKGSLWAVAMNMFGDSAMIHQINPETGEIAREFRTGWYRPLSNINGNLSSDGEHLLMIAIVDSAGTSPQTLSSFENSHERLLQLVPILAPEPPSLIFPVNGVSQHATSSLFSWSPCDHATSYHIQVALDSLFQDRVLEDSLVPAPERAVGPLLPHTKYFWRVCARNSDGNSSWSQIWSLTTGEVSSIGQSGDEFPEEYRLHQNHPNPFNPVTVIRYDLPKRTEVRLAVYNALGQEVALLVNRVEDAGYRLVRFDASGLASGVYIYRLQADGYLQSHKMVLVR